MPSGIKGLVFYLYFYLLTNDNILFTLKHTKKCGTIRGRCVKAGLSLKELILLTYKTCKYYVNDKKKIT